MTKQVVFLTIGEAPREDIRTTFDRYFSRNPHIVQDGVLNGWNLEEAKTHVGVTPESTGTLTSRFLTGESIVMDGEKVEAVMQRKIDEWEEKGASMIVLLCTGSFPTLTTRHALLIEAEKVTLPYVRSMYPTTHVGVLVPLAEQVEETKTKWALGERGSFASASPYAFTEESFKQATQKLVEDQSEVIVLDCIGYSDEMTRFVQSVAPDATIIQSNDVLFQFVEYVINLEHVA